MDIDKEPEIRKINEKIESGQQYIPVNTTLPARLYRHIKVCQLTKGWGSINQLIMIGVEALETRDNLAKEIEILKSRVEKLEMQK